MLQEFPWKRAKFSLDSTEDQTYIILQKFDMDPENSTKLIWEEEESLITFVYDFRYLVA